MDLVIIGTGNGAALLGRKCIAAGHLIRQVVGRNAKAASALAYEWHTVSTNYQGPIIRTADVYLMAVSDDAIDDIAADLRLPGRVIAHTAPLVPKEILKNISPHYGVFYPLQQTGKEAAGNYFISASDEQTRTVLEKLAASLSGIPVSSTDNDTAIQTATLLAEQLAGDFQLLLEKFCAQQGISRLVPGLRDATVPHARPDAARIRRQMALLEAYPELKALYQALYTDKNS